MQESWQLVYFKSRRGDFPVYIFIDSLPAKAQAKVSNTFDLLVKYGITLGLPHVKKLEGTGLWELRVIGGDNIRVFYVAITGRKFLLLHGFIKKGQKTDMREIKIALQRLNEYRLN